MYKPFPTNEFSEMERFLTHTAGQYFIHQLYSVHCMYFRNVAIIDSILKCIVITFSVNIIFLFVNVLIITFDDITSHFLKMLLHNLS